jgi:signal recognition particle subunit SRP54
VSRVLGMGDVLTLIEKAEQAITQDDAAKLEQKLRLDDFNLEDFRDQLRMVRKMGPLEHIIGLIPGMGNLRELSKSREEIDDKQVLRIEAIINSMTPRERRAHHIINGSRRKRIARGSGTSVEEVNRLLKQFVQFRKMIKMMGGVTGFGKKKKGRGMDINALRSMMK